MVFYFQERVLHRYEQAFPPAFSLKVNTTLIHVENGISLGKLRDHETEKLENEALISYLKPAAHGSPRSHQVILHLNLAIPSAAHEGVYHLRFTWRQHVFEGINVVFGHQRIYSF